MTSQSAPNIPAQRVDSPHGTEEFLVAIGILVILVVLAITVALYTFLGPTGLGLFLGAALAVIILALLVHGARHDKWGLVRHNWTSRQ